MPHWATLKKEIQAQLQLGFQPISTSFERIKKPTQVWNDLSTNGGP